MAELRDWAVIVGVQSYPGLSSLEGPVNDANKFEEWVLSPTGGNVNPDQVLKILSPDPLPNGFALRTALPIDANVRAAFDTVQNAVYPDMQGRRLYIYMAGHGIEPTSNEPAILMANAAERKFGYHILGRAYADWFFRAAAFAEILLFMDCCRDNYPAAPVNPVPWDPEFYPNAVDTVKYLYAFATQWSKRSRERTITEGAGKRGVFTYALLEGLNGAASRPDGYVTMGSLQDYLNENVKRFLAPEDRNAAGIPQQPDFARNPPAGEGFVIVQVPPKRWDVTIGLPAPAEGQAWDVDLLRGVYDPATQKYPPIARIHLDRPPGATTPTASVEVIDGTAIGAEPAVVTGASPQALKVSLVKGIYMVQALAAGRVRPFAVPNSEEGDGHVEFQL